MAKYRKAPITEAVIEFQIRPQAGTRVDALQVLHAEGTDADEKIRLQTSSFQIQLLPSLSTETEQQADGFAIKNNKRVVQWRVDRFTYSRLAPYGDWEDFQHDVRSLWAKYRSITAPEAVTRIALRYINRFDMPLPTGDLRDFFPAIPDIPQGIPQGIVGFFSQLQIPYEDIRAMLVLTQTIVPPPQAGLLSVVLDIDLSCANNLPSEEGALWKLLDQLRVKKNEVFEACITDAARELIR